MSSSSSRPPHDLVSLDVEAEWRNIEGALADLVDKQQLTLTRLPAATLGSLQQALRRQTVHILHFVGHGGFDPQSEEGVLFFVDETGHSQAISGSLLGTLLHDHAALRLVLLNACEGARTALTDPFAGVAQQLVRQGIPAVIAMQFEISDDAATILSGEFYGALADGYPVDAALGEARKSIFLQEQGLEWGTPVLYMRTEEGYIFDVAESTAAAMVDPSPVAATPTVRPSPIEPFPVWHNNWVIAVSALALLVTLLWLIPRWRELILSNAVPGSTSGTSIGTAEPGFVTTEQPPVTTSENTPNPLFRHTFEAVTDDWGDGADGTWLVLDDGTGNHVYQGQATIDAVAVSDPPEHGTMALLRDYAIALRMRVLKPGRADNDLFDTWLTFRYDVEGGDDCAYYNVYFDTRLNQVLLSSAAGCGFTALAAAPYNLEPGIWYDVRVTALGPHLSVAVNGETLIAVDDTTSARGTYYLTVDQSAIVQFDDIQVEKQ